jgi:hypothetical protein
LASLGALTQPRSPRLDCFNRFGLTRSADAAALAAPCIAPRAGWSVGDPVASQVDLLTVLEHEMGHLLGLADLSLPAGNSNVMNAVLSPGVRHISNLDAFFAGHFF